MNILHILNPHPLPQNCFLRSPLTSGDNIIYAKLVSGHGAVVVTT